jgi:mRNA interferase RelE/StbE
VTRLPSPYEVLLAASAERDLRRLPAPVHGRVITAIRSLANDPRPPGSRKLTGSKN